MARIVPLALPLSAAAQDPAAPAAGGAGKIFRIGKRPMNASVGAYYNVVKPDGAADRNVRFQLRFMFPKKPQ